jgi:hypothetical protein
VKVTLVLADYAEALNGKLYIMGGGWTMTGAAAGPMALAIKIEVPWTDANKKHTLDLSLVDGDGHPVLTQTPTGEEPLGIRGEFEVGRPPGLKPGTPLDTAIAVNIGRPPLTPDSRYTWELRIDGEARPDWSVAFSTRPEPPSMEA